MYLRFNFYSNLIRVKHFSKLHYSLVQSPLYRIMSIRLDSIIFMIVFLLVTMITTHNGYQYHRCYNCRSISIPIRRQLHVASTRLYQSVKNTPSSISSISSTIKDIRSSLSADERSSLMMDALRGKNINDDDSQLIGVDMKLVEMRSQDGTDDYLPTVYNPSQLEKYFNRRLGAVLTRIWQVLSSSGGFLLGLGLDYLTGNTEDIEVRRAAELRNIIVSLGPFFIKVGQALSIRPDILSPRAMVELQQLCDKVPCFDSALAMKTIEQELGRSPSELFSKITPEPVAAASLGQVYRATLAATNEEVAVKVQRPYVLETVSLDLYLVRQIGLFLRRFPDISSRLDIVDLLDEFASNFYQELDYNLECENGLRIAKDMERLPMVLIPRNYPEYTARRVHTAQWIDGEKLSQSKANDVSSLVNLGVITYLTQLLDTGFFHADPHPGNMLRSPDGRLVILDFGLMTRITDDQKYGMIEAIAHLIHRDYDRIGDDFVNLDFIPRGVDTSPIVPALALVFEAALAGGGAKSINFQELAAALADITFKFPFKIPPYFALIIRAISVLEGIALVGNPEFAIVDEAYPYISKRLMTDNSPRLKAAFKYMVYGRSDMMDVDRMIDMLQALEKFVAVKDQGDGTSFKVDGMRGNVFVGKAGDSKGTKKFDVVTPSRSMLDQQQQSAISRLSEMESMELRGVAAGSSGSGGGGSSKSGNKVIRESLYFFFSNDGANFREFVLDEIALGVDALSRDALRELIIRLGIPNNRIPLIFQAMAPRLDNREKKLVNSLIRLVTFLTGNTNVASNDVMDVKSSNSDDNNIDVVANFIGSLTPRNVMNRILSTSRSPAVREKLIALAPLFVEFRPSIQDFSFQLIRKLTNKGLKRLLDASLDVLNASNDVDRSDRQSIRPSSSSSRAIAQFPPSTSYRV